MAENVRNQKWLAVSFFLACGAVFLVFIYVISSGKVDRSYQNWMAPSRSAPESDSRTAGASSDNAMVIALKDRQVAVGNILLTYRGITSGRLRVDLVIPDLDSQYVYHRRIPVEAAEQEIGIAGRRFKILSINRQQIILLPIKPSN